jgi:hypothetical protein
MDTGPESKLVDIGTLSLTTLRSSEHPTLLESMRHTVLLAGRVQVWQQDNCRTQDR